MRLQSLWKLIHMSDFVKLSSFVPGGSYKVNVTAILRVLFLR